MAGTLIVSNNEGKHLARLSNGDHGVATVYPNELENGNPISIQQNRYGSRFPRKCKINGRSKYMV